MRDDEPDRPEGVGDALVRWGLAVVRGRSMLPTLRDGDRLLVQYGAVPGPGRLAVVRLDGVVAVKRVLRRGPDGWWVERDNAVEGRDSWSSGAVADRDVVAVVVGRLWPRPRAARQLRAPVRD